MNKDFAALAACKNDHVKLAIISARDPELLAGYQRAWPEYFTKGSVKTVPLNELLATKIAQEGDVGITSGMRKRWVAGVSGWGGCGELGIPTIQGVASGTPITPESLLFPLSFMACKPGSLVDFYDTRWLVVIYQTNDDRDVWITLAPLECLSE